MRLRLQNLRKMIEEDIFFKYIVIMVVSFVIVDFFNLSRSVAYYNLNIENYIKLFYKHYFSHQANLRFLG